MSATKKQFWKDISTLQSKEILTELIEAKENPCAKMLISLTGLGKTNTIKLFKQKYPRHTYVLVVGDSWKLEDVVLEIANMIGVDYNRATTVWRAINVRKLLAQIANKLYEIGEAGGNPMIVLDEAENLKPAVLKTIKELYDAIIDYCSIVLIGTPQILDSMLNKRNKNRTSVPQLYRRFKAGTRYISSLNKGRDFTPFFDIHIKGEEGIKAMLIEHADNYGELHDFIEPVLRYCDKKGVKLTEEIFRLFHKIPKRK